MVDITRSLGLDVGDVRIGVALGDPLGILASPLTIVTRHGGEEYDALSKIIADNAVERIVIGLPLAMDGGEGSQAAKTREFAEELARRTDLPLVFQDERLTTVEAQRMVREARKTTRTERYDAAAAALILQDYLNTAHPPAFPDEDGENGSP